MAQSRTTGWFIRNETANTNVYYDGIYHAPNTPREILFDDIREGFIDDRNLQLDILSGAASIAQGSTLWIRTTGQTGLDLLFAIPMVSETPYTYSFSRVGSVNAGTWLRVGEVPSNNSPHAIAIDITKMRVTATNGIYLDTTANPSNFVEISLYEKLGWLSFSFIRSFTLSNVRSISESSYTNVSFPSGTEICAKVTKGLALNPVLNIEVK